MLIFHVLTKSGSELCLYTAQFQGIPGAEYRVTFVITSCILQNIEFIQSYFIQFSFYKDDLYDFMLDTNNTNNKYIQHIYFQKV